MSKHIHISITKADNVKVETFERDSYGTIRQSTKRQITVSRREFERALDEATIEIPWRGLL